eukprot:1346622-Amorphochlora_amoeboformis.AAC.2
MSRRCPSDLVSRRCPSDLMSRRCPSGVLGSGRGGKCGEDQRSDDRESCENCAKVGRFLTPYDTTPGKTSVDPPARNSADDDTFIIT